MVNSFTYTANKSLVKPAFNNTGWNDPLNQNFDMLDAALGATQAMNLNGFAGGGILLTPTWPIVSSPLGSASYIPKRIYVNGIMGAQAVILVPHLVSGVWIVANYTTTTNNSNLYMQGQDGGSYVLCTRNQETLIYCDGNSAVVVGANLSSQFAVGDYKHSASPNSQTGWQICNGQSLPIATFPALWGAIGGYYGQVDGSHFNVPNLIGRVLGHADQGNGVTAGMNFAQPAGVSAVVLDISQTPSHNHNGGNHGHYAWQDAHGHNLNGSVLGSNGPGAGFGSGFLLVGGTADNRQPAVYVQNSGDTIAWQGSNGAHTNVQPSMGCYIFIYAGA
jgi:microcystin-dependent protein